MTEYTGEEFELPYAAAVVAWLKSGKVGPNPVALYQYVHIGDAHPAWRSPSGSEPLFGCNYIYRWKPAPKRMVTINGRELVAPETFAPAYSSSYHSMNYGVSPCHWNWQDTSSDKSNLKLGNVFLTLEDAQAMADWLTKCRRGQT